MLLYNEIILPCPTHQQKEAPTRGLDGNDAFRKWHETDVAGFVGEIGSQGVERKSDFAADRSVFDSWLTSATEVF
jgi:hypothetical protein